jgi:hypothetical protein
VAAPHDFLVVHDEDLALLVVINPFVIRLPCCLPSEIVPAASAVIRCFHDVATRRRGIRFDNAQWRCSPGAREQKK